MAYSGKKRSDCVGDEEVRENLKVPRMWIVEDEQDGDCITIVNHKGLNVDHWVRAQQKAGTAAPSALLGSFQQRAIASAMALQDIPNIDPTRPPVFQAQAQPIIFQAPAHSQSQPQPQPQSLSVTQLQAAKLSAQQQQKLQQQKLQLQLLQHQMQQQQQLQQKQQQLQQKQLQQQQQQKLQHQQQSKDQIQQQQAKQEQMQQQQLKLEQLQQLLQQEQQIQQDQLRWFQHQSDIPTGFGTTVCSPSPVVVPSNLKTCQQLSGDWDLQAALSAGPSCSYPVQNSCISRPQSSSSLISDAGNDQVSSILSNYHSEAQHPSGSCAAAGALVQELQTDASWIPSSSKDPPADPQLLPYSFSGRLDSSAVQGSLFSTISEQADQISLPSLSAQQLALLHRSSCMKEQEQVHSELLLPNRHSPSAAMIQSMMTLPAVVDTKGAANRPPNQLVVQNQNAYGKQPLIGNYSITAPDLPVSQSATVSGNCANEGVIQHQTFVQPRKQITRTYTKVIKLGSIGRAVDVNRFRNYTELRSELARMFGIEGQLDPESGWQLVFVDNENDLLLVGDDPWEEFVTSVRGIRILSPAEVTYFMNSDDRTGPPFNCMSSSVITRL